MTYGKRGKRNYKRNGKKRGNTVAKNAKAIRLLTMNQYKHCQYHLDYFSDDAAATGGFQAWPLVDPTNWNGIFQSNVINEEGDRFFIDRIILRMQVTVNNSIITPAVPDVAPSIVSPIQVALFLVSLQKETASETLARTTNLTAMHANSDYHKIEVGATLGESNWILNKKLYKVHASRRFRVGNFADEGGQEDFGPEAAVPQVTNTVDTRKRCMFNQVWKRRIQRGVGEFDNETKKTWKQMGTSAIEPHDQLFLIFFSAAEGLQEVSLAYSTMIYGKTPI